MNLEKLGRKEERICLEIEDRLEEDRTQQQRTEGQIEIEKTVWKQLTKLKKDKSPRSDRIDNETWKYMPKEIGETYLNLINKIWIGEGFPEDWKMSLITPIYKRGDKGEVENYRGITLLNTAYKVWNSKPTANRRSGRKVSRKSIGVQKRVWNDGGNIRGKLHNKQTT